MIQARSGDLAYQPDQLQDKDRKNDEFFMTLIFIALYRVIAFETDVIYKYFCKGSDVLG